MARKKTDFLLSIGDDFLIMEKLQESKEEIEARMEMYAQIAANMEEEEDGAGDQL